MERVQHMEDEWTRAQKVKEPFRANREQGDTAAKYFGQDQQIVHGHDVIAGFEQVHDRHGARQARGKGKPEPGQKKKKGIEKKKKKKRKNH